MTFMHSITRVGVLLVTSTLAGCVTSSTPDIPPHATALQACQAAGTGALEVAVEMDRADASALVLASDGQIATCWASRDGAGFGSASVGSGFYAVTSPATLSYLTGQEAGPDAILVGRYPASTHVVRVTLLNGTAQEATIGNGVWLALVSRFSKPGVIEALDASGATLGRLDDPHGIDASTQ